VMDPEIGPVCSEPLRPRRRARWIAGAYPRPSGSVIATKASSVRTRESRSSSCEQSIDIEAGKTSIATGGAWPAIYRRIRWISSE
jgi:hypothetical protein